MTKFILPQRISVVFNHKELTTEDQNGIFRYLSEHRRRNEHCQPWQLHYMIASVSSARAYRVPIAISCAPMRLTLLRIHGSGLHIMGCASAKCHCTVAAQKSHIRPVAAIDIISEIYRDSPPPSENEIFFLQIRSCIDKHAIHCEATMQT